MICMSSLENFNIKLRQIKLTKHVGRLQLNVNMDLFCFENKSTKLNNTDTNNTNNNNSNNDNKTKVSQV